MDNSKTANRAAGITALPTQQRRLRHLRSLAARNVQLKKRRTSLDVTQLQMFFTLHTDSKSNPFYTSEKIRGSLNPVWKSFSLIHVNEGKNIDTTGQSLTVRVWYGQTCQSDLDYDCCIRWDVHLSGLVYLGSKILNDRNQHPPNTLIFGLQDGFYGAPETDKESGTTTRLRRFTVDADVSLIRESYSVRSLLRVQTVLRAIKQTQRGVARERLAINARLLELENLRCKKAQREQALIKVNMIRNDLHWRLTQLQSLEHSYETIHMENLHRVAMLKKKRDQLINDSEVLHERKKRYFDVRDELIKTGAQLVLRRKQLLSELAYIYPIQRLQNNVDQICGVHLPHSEGFAGHDETEIAIALGYTCHLVMMISSFFDIPLRYPMDHRGSRSMIRDHIITKLSEKERDFPLFSKGREKYQFQYGVFILNKNIAQLRHYCGMPTPDLRQTLANISTLLCDKLGIAINRNDAFTNQHSLIPPSFGGPQKSSQMSHSQNQVMEAVKDATALSVDFSIRTNQMDPRLEEIEEEGGEVNERHSNVPAVSLTESSSCKDSDIALTTDAISCSPFSPGSTDLKSNSSPADSSHPYTNEEPINGVATSNRIMHEGVCLRICQQMEDFPSPQSREGLSLGTTGTPCTDDLDVSSNEDAVSLLYCSQFGKWDSTVTQHKSTGSPEENNSFACNANLNGLLQKPCDSNKLQDLPDPNDVVSTFKTWNMSGKEWERQWNEMENDGTVEANKFTDSGTSDS